MGQPVGSMAPWATTCAATAEQGRRSRGVGNSDTPEALDARVRELHEAGVRALRAGNAWHARGLLNEALNLNAGSDDVKHAAQRNAARAAATVGDHVTALRLYWHCAASDPSDVSAWHGAASAALETYRPSLARAASEQALLRSPHNPLLKDIQSIACECIGDTRRKVHEPLRKHQRLQRAQLNASTTCSAPSPYSALESFPSSLHPSDHATALASEWTWPALLEAIATLLPHQGHAPPRRLRIRISSSQHEAERHGHSHGHRPDRSAHAPNETVHVQSDEEMLDLDKNKHIPVDEGRQQCHDVDSVDPQGHVASANAGLADETDRCHLQYVEQNSGAQRVKPQIQAHSPTKRNRHEHRNKDTQSNQYPRRSNRLENFESGGNQTQSTEPYTSVQQQQLQPNDDSLAATDVVSIHRRRQYLLASLRRYVGVPEGDILALVPSLEQIESASTSANNRKRQRRSSICACNEQQTFSNQRLFDDKHLEEKAVSDLVTQLDDCSYLEGIQTLLNNLPESLPEHCAALVRHLDAWLWSVNGAQGITSHAHLLAGHCQLLYLKSFVAHAVSHSDKAAARGREERDAENLAWVHMRSYWSSSWDKNAFEAADVSQHALYHWITGCLLLLSSNRGAVEAAQRHMRRCIDCIRRTDGHEEPADGRDIEQDTIYCGRCPSLSVVEERTSELDSRSKLEWARSMNESQHYQAVVETLAPMLLHSFSLPASGDLNYQEVRSNELHGLAFQQEERALSILSRAVNELNDNIAPLKLMTMSKRMRCILKMSDEQLFNLLTESRRGQTLAMQMSRQTRICANDHEPYSASVSEALHHMLTTAIAAVDRLTFMALQSLTGSHGKLSGKRGAEKLNESPAYLLEVVVMANAALSERYETTLSHSFIAFHEQMHGLLSLSHRCGPKKGHAFTSGSIERVSKAILTADPRLREHLKEAQVDMLNSNSMLQADGGEEITANQTEGSDITMLQRFHEYGAQMISCRFSLVICEGIQQYAQTS